MKEVVSVWLGIVFAITGSFLAAFYLGTSAATPNLTIVPVFEDPQIEVDAASEAEIINAGHFEPWVRGSADDSL